MLATVCDADCKTLLSSSGTRNIKKSRHIGRLSSKMLTCPRRGAGRAAAIGARVGGQGANLFFLEMPGVRLDKFMKVSRLSKRRSEAHEALVHGRITKDGRPLKPGYDVHPGDVLEIHYATKFLT